MTESVGRFLLKFIFSRNDLLLDEKESFSQVVSELEDLRTFSEPFPRLVSGRDAGELG